MSLVHIAFRGSFLAYNAKRLAAAAICFFSVMCIIGGFYMIFLFIDFGEGDEIESPEQCRNFDPSLGTRWIIRSGFTCDAAWSITCLLLFYSRLSKITTLMHSQQEHSRLDRIAMNKKYANGPKNDSVATNTSTTNGSNSKASQVTLAASTISAVSLSPPESQDRLQTDQQKQASAVT